MENTTNLTVGQWVAQNYKTAQIFRNYGIDFCCGGGISVEKACSQKNAPYVTVLSELESLGNTASVSENYNSWKLDFLADYIVNTHHDYIKNKLPELNFYANKVARVHGERHPELYDILRLFLEIEQEMSQHMMKEEHVLFPFIKEMVSAQISAQQLSKPPFGTVKHPVEMMEHEHDSAGRIMEEIQQLTNNFTPPDDACTTYRVLFQNLKAFQEDLHKHVHLENNILFPKATKLEELLLQN
jgi:regulator of cell morphogenesis and NO signaling